MHRLFIAIDPPPTTTADKLASLYTGVPGERWIRPDQFQMTVRFAGECNTGQLSDIREPVAKIFYPPSLYNFLVSDIFPAGQDLVHFG